MMHDEFMKRLLNITRVIDIDFRVNLQGCGEKQQRFSINV